MTKLPETKPFQRGVVLVTLASWLCVYTPFLIYAAFDRSGFLFPDNVNLIIHEGGHFFFSWFGRTIMILGGTLGGSLFRYSAPFIFLRSVKSSA